MTSKRPIIDLSAFAAIARGTSVYFHESSSATYRTRCGVPS